MKDNPSACFIKTGEREFTNKPSGYRQVIEMDSEELTEKKEDLTENTETAERSTTAETELAEIKDRHVRHLAEFENYKKRVQKDKEEILRYGNESLLYDLLPVIDNLEMALKHSDLNISNGLVKGVEITLREFQRVMEKFGVTPIPALGKPFDPALHHAMAQVERTDIEDQTVVEEMRKGYMLGGKVLRASMVSVSKLQEKTEPEIIN